MVEKDEALERREDGVVVVKPKPSKGLASKAIDWLEWAFVKTMLHHPTQPLHYVSGNFAPVDETPPSSDLPVKGHLPECLNGEFVRVGPNPKFAPVAGYHWFDGDGMIHGLRIKDGKATYVSRFVKTSRLKQEEYHGGSKFVKLGDLKGMFGLVFNIETLRSKFKVLDQTYGRGTANTNIVYHQGKLLALHEGDKPYAIKILEDGDLQTLGMVDYDKRLQHPFTAHPKVDPVTGEMFTFGYSPQKKPYLTYRVISKDGLMDDPVPITVSGPVMMHDFAITENYAIFMDLPLYFKPAEMVKNKKLIFDFDYTAKARFGILPRYAKSEALIKWFELPNCFIFHNANAWEEGDEVVLITCRLQNPDLDMFNGPVKKKVESWGNELYEMRFDLKTGFASQKRLSAIAVEFPRVNENYTGRTQRYVYGTILDGISKITGIVKFDLHAKPEDGEENLPSSMFDLGHGRFGSEAVFIPRQPNTESEEDDGYLIHFVYDENSGKSSVNVIDARTMSPDPIAVVELPNRVPFGFHAFFVTEEQLQEQAKLGGSKVLLSGEPRVGLATRRGVVSSLQCSPKKMESTLFMSHFRQREKIFPHLRTCRRKNGDLPPFAKPTRNIIVIEKFKTINTLL